MGRSLRRTGLRAFATEGHDGGKLELRRRIEDEEAGLWGGRTLWMSQSGEMERYPNGLGEVLR